MQVDVRANHRTLDNLEIKSRETNLIIDGLMEIPGEITIQHVNSFLCKFIPSFDIGMIDNAYRLGHPPSTTNKSPRRILLRTASTFTRSLILEYAESIAKTGLPGARVYITEDLPESIKRRRQDIHKYVAFLKELGIDAMQKRDCVIFNGTLYKYEEILNMDEGFSFKDSRTKCANGVIAFQSCFSPLSNLFIAPIKRNGIVFRSSEHAYQHAKAIFNKDYAMAKFAS